MMLGNGHLRREVPKILFQQETCMILEFGIVDQDGQQNRMHAAVYTSAAPLDWTQLAILAIQAWCDWT